MEEIRTLVYKISEKYVKSWYLQLSRDKEFLIEIADILEVVLFAASSKLSKINISVMFHKILLCFHQHFSVYLKTLQTLTKSESKHKLIEGVNLNAKVEEHYKVTHLAVEDLEEEYKHVTSLSAAIVKVLAPPDVLSCPLVYSILVDIIAYNVLLPLVQLLVNSNWLNWVVFNVFSDKSTPLENSNTTENGFVEVVNSSSSKPENVNYSLTTIQSSSQLERNNDSVTFGAIKPRVSKCNVHLHLNLQNSVKDNTSLSTSNAHSSEDQPLKVSMESEIIHEDFVNQVKDPIEFNKKNRVIFDVTEKQSSSERDVWSLEISKPTKYPFSFLPGRSVPPRSDTLSMLTFPNKTDQPASVESDALRTKIKRSKSLDIISQVMPRLSQVLPMSSNNFANECGKFTCKAKKGNANSLPRTKYSMSSEDIEAIELPETATEAFESDAEFTLFTGICITSTEQRLEEGKGSYTLYCIQDGDEFQSHWVKHLSTVKRRFREFLTLHSRLEENQRTRKYLKGIKGPSKWLMTPFSALDKKNIEERRVFLQSYLEKLCSREIVLNSAEMREFFAYGGDASIAYVRKTNEVGVPRIDKMLVRGVKGAIDLIRTALPSLSTDFIENIHVLDIVGDKCGHSKSLLPVFGRSRIEERHLEIEFQYSKEKACNLEQQMYKYVSNFESASSVDASQHNSSQDRPRMLSFFGRNKIEKKKNTKPDSENWANDEEESIVSSNDKLKKLKWRIKKEIPFADVVIDLILLTFTEPKNKYTKAKFVVILKILFGQILNRWLEKKLFQFTTKEWCAQYLHFLHEALWPNSESTHKKDDNIHQQNEAIEAMNSFFSFLSPVLVSSVQFRESISLLVGSLQNEKLNKDLVYNLLDILIDNIVSDSSSDSSS
ncbi:uncharacterized protein LOC143252847 isoform X2 [Tachypleus tridentatus]|uniref:uncharacterized protein LOC143252847 isoform X2 n=1 Tax=Tachypleus tridentatus TaxID=6853 RepID=UPI003FD629CD